MHFLPVFPGLLLLLVALADATALDLADLRDPRPSRWSLDESGQLKRATLDALNELGQQVRNSTGHELVVVAVTSTDGENQRNVGTRLFNRWGIGDRTRDDGVLLFVALGDRRVEFILGDGVDEHRHVAISQEIVDRDMLPLFRRGDPDQAVLAGARAAARRLLDYTGMLASQNPPAQKLTVAGDNVMPASHNPPAQKLAIEHDNVRIENLPVELETERTPTDHPFSELQSPPGSFTTHGREMPMHVDSTWQLWGLAGGAGGGTLGFVLWRRWLRNRPRNCDRCQQPMERLGEYEDDQHLSHGEQTEERVGSVDYDIWCCTACPRVMKLRYGTWFTRYARCPRCRSVTKSSRQTTLVEATYDHGGQVRVNEACAACDYRNSFTRSTPRKTRPSSNNGIGFGSGGRSSGGSFGGGRSSGGGFGGGRSSGRGGGGGW